MDEMFSLLLEHQGGISNCFCNVGKKKFPEFLELFIDIYVWFQEFVNLVCIVEDGREIKYFFRH